MNLNLCFFYELAVIFHAFMASLVFFVPFGVVALDKVQEVLFGFNVGNTDKIVNIAVTNLAAVFHAL